MNKIRIGVLTDDFNCPSYLYHTLSGLADEPNIELFLLQNESPHQDRITSVRKHVARYGFFRSIDLAFFSIIAIIEKEIISILGYSDICRIHFSANSWENKIFKEIIRINPHFLKAKMPEIPLIVSYEEKDIRKIQALNLDLIIGGNGSRIYQGEILAYSKNGVISLQFGDDRWNRGEPPGFWEAFYRRPSTGFRIQLAKEQQNDGDVIFRGEVITTSSYLLNQAHLYQISYLYLKQIIIDFTRTGVLPEKLPPAPFCHRHLKIPAFSITCRYFVMTCSKFASLLVGKVIFNHEIRYSVAFIGGDWRTVELSKAMVIKNPKGRFLADPFVIKYHDETVIFVEDFHYSRNRATISAVRILPDKSYEILPDIIQEDFHLSFPYIFIYKNDLYMVPESDQSRTIRLYKCIHFPEKWEYQYDILQNVSAMDTMIFEHSGTWWLFSSIVPEGMSNEGARLLAFTADSPLSKDWRPHKKNPICFSTDFGRNGGILRDEVGNVYRVRQKQGFGQCGVAFTIARIRRLDIENYEEDFYCEVLPDFFLDLSGTHHMTCDHGMTVFDFVKMENIS